MAVSAASALVATVSTSSVVTAGGFALFSAASLKYFLVSTAIGAAINALTPKPATPKAQGYTVTARGSNLDHQIIYGKTRVGGVVAADFLSGEGGAEGTRFLHRVQVMAGHEVESYEEIYMNSYKVSKWQVRGAGIGGDQTIDDVTDITPYVDQPFNILVPVEFVEVASDGTETIVDDLSYKKYGGLAMQFWTGADDQTASTKLIADIPNNQWTSNHRLRGRAYIYVRMGRDADGDNFPTGVPDITAVVKGRKVYDPRNVAHNPADKSTWEWSDNPALCIRDYLTQDFGLGEKDIQVDDNLVSTAANVCDQTVTDGSTRYTCNGAFTTGIQPYDLLNSILTSMGGLLWYAQGQWRMKPAYWTSPVETFDEDDFRSAINVSTRHSRRDNFNTVQGSFRGPQTNYAETTYPAVTSAASVTADGGIESSIDLEMPFTDTFEEARRIARIVLERNRQQVTLRASFGLKAFRVQVGDVVNLSLERFGWVNKTFEVTEWSFGNVDQYDIQVELTLREITEDVFDEVDDGATFEVDNANVPSPLAGLTVSNLTAITNGFFSTDGSFINNVLVDWDAPINSNVAEYAVEWRVDNFDYASNGGIATLGGSPTDRELFIYQAYEDILYRQPDQDGFDFYNTGAGSSLTEDQIKDQLETSSEGVAAQSYVFNGVKVNGTASEYNIYPVEDDKFYSIRVRAINDFGTGSLWSAATVDASKDVTAPNTPTSLSAEGGYKSTSISWIAPTQNTNGSDLNDLKGYIVYGGTSPSPTTPIGQTPGESFSHNGLLSNTTYYYRVTAIDYSGNESAYSSQTSATTDAEAIDGADGLNVATVNLFNKNTSSLTPPTDPTGTFTYTFSTGALTGGTPNGWSQNAPSIGKGEYLWQLTAQASSTSATDTIPASEFNESEKVVGIGGEDGIDGDTGARGAGRWNIPVATLPTTSSEANSAYLADTVAPEPPVADDQAWFYTGTESNPTGQSVWIYNGSVWNEQDEVIDGNLLVTNTVTAGKINSNGLTIKDEFGNVILQATGGSTGVDLSKVLNAGAFAGLDQITSANVSTYIDSAAIGEAFIGNLSASKITAGTFDVNRIPTLPQSQVTDLTTDLSIGIGRATTFYQSTAPTANNEGDVWYDTTNDKVKRWNGTSWVEFTIEAESVAADWVYAGTLTAEQVNAVNIDADSITVGTLSADLLEIDGITLDTSGDQLIIKDNGVSEVVSNTGSTLLGSTTSAYQTAASVSLTVPTGLTGDIILFWSIEQSYPDGIGPEWGVRIKDGATALYDRTGMQAQADFPSGHYEITGATGSKTYNLEWWSDEPVVINITGKGTLTALARWK